MNNQEENTQACPECDNQISAVQGSKSAVCNNCGFKDSCCF